MGTPLFAYQGLIQTGSGNSPFGRMLAGESWDSVTSLPRALFVDKSVLASGATISSSLAGSSMGEQYSMGVVGAGENAHILIASIPAATASGSTHFKNGFASVVNTQAVSNYAGNIVYQATGLVGQAISAGTVTQATLCGVSAQATVSTGTDATASGLQVTVLNNGTAVSAVNSALSKYCILLQSAGAAKNTAFLYANKQFAGAAGSINCSHGILVDSASIDANAFAVVSGVGPTVVWGVQPSGKVSTNNSDITIANQGVTAALTSSQGLLTITALTLAAATSINVACTTAAGLGVTTASRVILTPQQETGAAAGFVVACADTVAANAFNIRLTNTAAATAYGGGAFTIYYEIKN
jgi:hypothetical protein